MSLKFLFSTFSDILPDVNDAVVRVWRVANVDAVADQGDQYSDALLCLGVDGFIFVFETLILSSFRFVLCSHALAPLLR